MSCASITSDSVLQNRCIKTTNLTDDIVRIALGAGNLVGIGIFDLTLDASVAKTSGYGISIASTGGNLYNSSFGRLYMTAQMFSGVNVEAALYLDMRDILIFGIAANGIGFRLAGFSSAVQVGDVYLNNLRVANGVSGGITIGYLFDSWVQGYYCSYLSAESKGLDYGIFINDSQNTGTSTPMNMLFNQCICDSQNKYAVNIVNGKTLRFTDQWASGAG